MRIGGGNLLVRLPRLVGEQATSVQVALRPRASIGVRGGVGEDVDRSLRDGARLRDLPGRRRAFDRRLVPRDLLIGHGGGVGDERGKEARCAARVTEVRGDRASGLIPATGVENLPRCVRLPHIGRGRFRFAGLLVQGGDRTRVRAALALERLWLLFAPRLRDFARRAGLDRARHAARGDLGKALVPLDQHAAEALERQRDARRTAAAERVQDFPRGLVAPRGRAHEPHEPPHERGWFDRGVALAQVVVFGQVLEPALAVRAARLRAVEEARRAAAVPVLRAARRALRRRPDAALASRLRFTAAFAVAALLVQCRSRAPRRARRGVLAARGRVR